MVKYYLIIFLSFNTLFLKAQSVDANYMRQQYSKKTYNIPMRDGIKLYTLVYTPKDTSKTYPILLNRTCYNASNHDNFKANGQPSDYLLKDQYILVYQDVRGRYMSEGKFTTLTPNIPGNNLKDTDAIDESSDTFDTVEWLINNLPNNNKKLGIFGISYPGFYTAAALPNAHPSLKAASPQAPISDFFFDDFIHNGAYLLSYTAAFPVFGYQKSGLTKKPWYIKKLNRLWSRPAKDAYRFYLDLGPLKNITRKYHYDNFFWNEIINHPNYDSFWKKRNILPHLKNINTAVMTVGGWYDAEDLYGPLNIYKTIEANNPEAQNTIVMGPWAHGDWAREKGKHVHNHIYYGDSISTFYQKNIERQFFAYHLKDKDIEPLPEAYMYDTGVKEWQTFDVWPPKNTTKVKLYFDRDRTLVINNPTQQNQIFKYISDPDDPVPYRSETEGLTFTPRKYMTDDQRHASRREDVLTFYSEVLNNPLTIAGEIKAYLKVAITGTDADFVVKIIDQYPEDHINYAHNSENIQMGGYQQLVRAEVIRGRFRESFEFPKPFKPNQKTAVNLKLQDILHTFKKGHRIVVQLQSSWFPYIDRNPQNYVPNIFEAEAGDFTKSKISIYGDSMIELGGHVK